MGGRLRKRSRARDDVDKTMAVVERALAPGTLLSVSALASKIKAIMESHLSGVANTAQHTRAGREAQREMHLRLVEMVMSSSP